MKRKNKAAEAGEVRAQRRNAGRDAKARRQQQADYGRGIPTRTERPILLIVCQGTRTEKDYFDHFELATARIDAVPYHRDPEGLIEHAIGLRNRARTDEKPYEQVWCVFDKDDSSAQQVHETMARAQQEKIKIAFSNQSFEYWLLLHFLDHQGGGLDRHDCTVRLMALIEQQSNSAVYYDGFGTKRISRALFDLLEAHVPVGPGGRGRHPRRKLAIGRARKIAATWKRTGRTPAEQESSTSVYELVTVLQKHLPTN